jgi:hypothetical protein
MQSLQILVTLQHCQPRIWRRVLVSERASLAELHEILQLAMGWTDSHLYGFYEDRRSYLDPDRVVEPFGDWRDARETSLSELRLGPSSRFRYSYDFGDGWDHDLLVEEVGLASEAAALPICLGGARACPPEDCGGPPGLAELLRALDDPESVDPEFLAWIPEGYDATHFDLEEVNELLRDARA